MSVPSARDTGSPWRESVVEAMRSRTPRCTSFFLRHPLPAHRPGQHVDVRLVADDGYEARRSYSIASAPGDGPLELLVERLPDGEVSPYFHDVLRPGDTLELRGPLGGHFVWRGEADEPLLLVAGGSGIAPLMAMLRHRRAAVPQVPALLLYGARSRAEMAYADELDAMAVADPGFGFVAATSREPAGRAGDLGRRLDRNALAGALQRWPHAPRQVFLCGSTGFVETLASALIGLGVPAPAIRTERYGGV